MSVSITPDDLNTILKGNHIRRWNDSHFAREQTDPFLGTRKCGVMFPEFASDFCQICQKLLRTLRVTYWFSGRHLWNLYSRRRTSNPTHSTHIVYKNTSALTTHLCLMYLIEHLVDTGKFNLFDWYQVGPAS